MKKLLTLGIAISFTCSLLVIPAFGIAKAGAPCTKAGVTSIVSGKKFTCVKSGKKLVWDKGVLIANSTQQKTSPATSVENSQVILLPGSTCKVSSSVGVKVASGTLYCVQVSDGSYKYIEHFDAIPSINNPQSPEPLEACEAPDLRGNIPPEMSILRIAHDSVVSASKLLKHTGTLNLVVVPIDFSDAIGVSTPKSVYGSDFDMMTKWFSDFSNQKLQLSVQMKNNWFRAPLPSANYDPSLWPSNDYDTQQKVVQKYIDLTSPQIDYSSADAVVFVYPKAAFASTGYLHLWNAEFNGSKGKLSFSVLSSLGTADQYEPFWQWMSHELLHSMGIAMHSPANPAGWGIEWGRYSYSEALLPWNQMLLDWINPDQYYCQSASKIFPTKLTLIPQQSTSSGLRGVFIRVSNSEVLMIVSYRNDTWAYNTPNNFYGTMVGLFDTSKQVDMSGEHIDDNFDGVKYQKPGLWLHPNNKVPDDNSWTNLHTGEGGALMYLGDSVTYKGIKIQLVESNNFDTVEITRS
jgi:hypothetical protein